MSILEVFENEEILITGGSGFIGKMLIAKLLVSCPNVSRIYLLMREKKNCSGKERLKLLLNDICFQSIREERSHLFEKLEVINGDCDQLGLGISAEDLDKLQNVGIIYHNAANVKFDETATSTIISNTLGTHELVKIALNLKKLKMFMHVSTLFCNTHQNVLEEKIYPTFVHWRKVLEHVEKVDEDTMSILKAKYSDFHPNNYTFSKQLAENIIEDYSHQLPMVLVRPSIVNSSLAEPFPGWVDNFNGPVGLLVACGAGIMHTDYRDPDANMHSIPVDLFVRFMLVATYNKITKDREQPELSRQLAVYNCTHPYITLRNLLESGKSWIAENPMEHALWLPSGMCTSSAPRYLLMVFLTQLLPSILGDFILRLIGRDPFLLKIQRRIFQASEYTRYFSSSVWQFKNEKFKALQDVVPIKDDAEFQYRHIHTLNLAEFVSNAVKGAKLCLLKQNPTASPAARGRYTMLKAIEFVAKVYIFQISIKFIKNYIFSII